MERVFLVAAVVAVGFVAEAVPPRAEPSWQRDPNMPPTGSSTRWVDPDEPAR